MPHDPWARSASPDYLRALAQKQVLPEAAARRALELAAGTPPARDWLRVLRTGLLVVGSALLLAGVIFFFAWNWADLGRITKLGVIAVAIVAAAVVAWEKSPSLTGHVALFAACVLEGALLAVYGQAYQTGADPYELFTGWMLLILPWVIAARTPAFFALELVLLNTALTLFWVQVLEGRSTHPALLALLLFAVNALALAAFELYRRRTGTTDAHDWLPRLLAVWCFGLLVWPALVAVVGNDLKAPDAAVFVMLLLAVAAASFFFGKGRARDLFVLTTAWSSALVVADTLLGRLFFTELELEISGFFLLGLLVLVEVGALVTLLRRLARDAAPEVA